MNLRDEEQPLYARLFLKLFAGRSKNKERVEVVETPLHLIVSNFRSNRIAMMGLGVFTALFLMVLIVPIACPLNVTEQEVTQQNVSPGRNLLSFPKQLEGKVAQISVGATFSVGLSTDGEVYVWGKKSKALSRIPKEMGKVVQISAGTNHILALNEDGKLFAWGSNRFHQTDIPDTIHGIVQIYAGNQCSLVVTGDGEVVYWGNRNLIDFDASGYQGKIKRVVANNNHVLAILVDGKVAVLGRKESAFINIPMFQSAVVDLVMTNDCAYALDQLGNVYAWGKESGNAEVHEAFLELDSIRAEHIVSLVSGCSHVTALTNHGNVITWGDNQKDQKKVPRKIGKHVIETVWSGAYQNYAVDESGHLYGWGFRGYLMGTDGYGRDVFTRLMSGGRLTMTIGAVAVLLQTILGILIGGIAGFYGGKIDNVLMRFTEVVNSLPFLPFAMILSAMIGNKLTQMQRIYMIMVVLGVLSWPGMARLVRAQVLSEKNKEFVTAAKAIGVSKLRIIFQHIMPNVISIVIVSATASFAASMLTESSLSFLGFGVTEPNPTWGNMLTGSQSSTVISVYWWRWVFPALALSLATISINLVGDGLRDAMDPKSKW